MRITRRLPRQQFNDGELLSAQQVQDRTLTFLSLLRGNIRTMSAMARPWIIWETAVSIRASLPDCARASRNASATKCRFRLYMDAQQHTRFKSRGVRHLHAFITLLGAPNITIKWNGRATAGCT